MKKFINQYIEQIKDLLDQVVEDNSAEFEQAASIMADAIAGDGRIFGLGKHPFINNDAGHLCKGWWLDGD